jgi:hypothetical protein
MSKKYINTPSEVNPIKPTKRGVRERIRAPRSPYRPIKIGGDVIKRGTINRQPDRFTIHKRGIHRPELITDPREMYAVPKWQVYGSLPERIMYRQLIEICHLVPEIDFDFQSALDGGRAELGGIIVDFMFYNMKVVIQVEGAQHKDFITQKKDIEQQGILESMGYTVFKIGEDKVYDIFYLDNWLRKIFNLSMSFSSADSGDGSPKVVSREPESLDILKGLFLRMRGKVMAYDY